MIGYGSLPSDAESGRLSDFTSSAVGPRSRHQIISRPSRTLELPASHREMSTLLSQPITDVVVSPPCDDSCPTAIHFASINSTQRT